MRAFVVVALSVSSLWSASRGMSTAPVQPASITGTWNAQVPEAVRNEDGVQTVESTVAAVLRLEAKGDSVSGTITRGKATIARPLKGTVKGSAVTLLGQTKARVYTNGAEHELNIIATYRLTLSGDTLRGTIETKLDSASAAAGAMLPGVEQSPMPIVAVRTANAPAPPPPPHVRDLPVL
jgi:hypothetical protein